MVYKSTQGGGGNRWAKDLIALSSEQYINKINM